MPSTSIPMEENKEKVTALRLILRDIAGVKVSTIWVRADAYIGEHSHIPTVEMSNIIARNSLETISYGSYRNELKKALEGIFRNPYRVLDYSKVESKDTDTLDAPSSYFKKGHRSGHHQKEERQITIEEKFDGPFGEDAISWSIIGSAVIEENRYTTEMDWALNDFNVTKESVEKIVEVTPKMIAAFRLQKDIIAFDRNLNNDDYQTEPNKEDFKNRVSSRFEAL